MSFGNEPHPKHQKMIWFDSFTCKDLNVLLRVASSSLKRPSVFRSKRNWNLHFCFIKCQTKYSNENVYLPLLTSRHILKILLKLHKRHLANVCGTFLRVYQIETPRLSLQQIACRAAEIGSSFLAQREGGEMKVI